MALSLEEGVSITYKTVDKQSKTEEASARSHECGDAGCGTPVVGLKLNSGSSAAGNPPSDAKAREGQV
jgi:hypothetical protein